MQNEVNPQAGLEQAQGEPRLETVEPTGVQSEEQEKKQEDKVIIHTMPKRFYRAASGTEKTKNVGVLIIIFGIIFLLAIAVFSYFFLIKPANEEAALLSEKEVSPAVVEKEKPVENKPLETVPEVIENLNVATTTPEIEEELVEEEATTTPETEIVPVVEIKTSPDSDRDGLSDVEETMLGTIANLRDTDGDGYDDLSEFLGLYNPAGTGSIITNPEIEKYINTRNGYSLYYPKKMTIENVGGSEDSVMFKFFDGQMIQVVVETNTENLSLEEWYKKQFGVSLVTNDQRVYKKGWTGIRSDNGLVVYLVNPASDKIYSLSYNISVDNTLSRKNILELMVNSFELK